MQYQEMTDVSTGEKLYKNKLIWGAISAAIFVMASAPQVYAQTSRLTLTASDNCPTPTGKFIHAALFFGVLYFVMKLSASQKWLQMEGKSDGLMAKWAFHATLLFFLVASSDTYRLTNGLISGVSNEFGCPEMKGILIHGLVFMALVVLMMYLPKD